MMFRNPYFIISIALLVVLAVVFMFTPPRRILLVVDKLPPNTPQGALIFVAGNFNYWDPGDGNFQLEKGSDGKYRIELPLAWGGIQYKFTRGDWTTVEGDGCGHSIDNRVIRDATVDDDQENNKAVSHRIFSWEDLGPTDCDKVVVRLTHIPKETPKDGPIFISGSFNDWKPDHPAARFKKSENGVYMVELPKSDIEIEFKITRGSWTTEEVDENGDRIPNRKFNFGKKDTLNLEIPGWLDIKPGLEARHVTFLVKTPMGTPPNDPLFIVGSFNKWKPGDPSYKLAKISPNLFSITLKKPEGEMEYKFTRGGWGKEEMDVFGNHISNRKLRTSADTIRISIPEWRDIPMDQTSTMKNNDLDEVLSTPEFLAFPPVKGEKYVYFRVQNKSDKIANMYVRLALPNSPNNRNYGFVARIKPTENYFFSCPSGTRIYSCEGKYWDRYRPKETLILEVDKSHRSVDLDADWLVWKPNQMKVDMKNLPEGMDMKIPPPPPMPK